MSVELVAARVRALMTGEASGHDWEHVNRVWHTALALAKAEGVAPEDVSYMVLTHDLDDAKLSGDPMTEKHQPLARAILAEAGLSAEKVDEICAGVQSTGYRKALAGIRPTSAAAQILSDADFLDAIGCIGIARVMAFGGNRGRPIFIAEALPVLGEISPEDYVQAQNTGIQHFLDKLLKLKDMMFTEAGKAEAAKRQARMVQYLEGFFEEVGADPLWPAALRNFS